MCVSRVPSHRGCTQGVSTEPIHVCGSVRWVIEVVRKDELWALLHGDDFWILTQAETKEESQRRVG